MTDKDTQARKEELLAELEELEAEAEQEQNGGGILRKLLFLGSLAGAVGWFLKRKRERELDEALWEEPRAL